MNTKVRSDIVPGYIFPSRPGLVWHSGHFWYNDISVKKVYNNGSISLLINRSKIGIKKLRKEAVKKNLIVSDCPF